MVQLEWKKNENTFFLSLKDLHSPNLDKFHLSLHSRVWEVLEGGAGSQTGRGELRRAKQRLSEAQQ